MKRNATDLIRAKVIEAREVAGRITDLAVEQRDLDKRMSELRGRLNALIGQIGMVMDIEQEQTAVAK